MAFNSSESIRRLARQFGVSESEVVSRAQQIVAGGDSTGISRRFNLSPSEVQRHAAKLVPGGSGSGNPFLNGMSEEFEALPDPAPTPEEDVTGDFFEDHLSLRSGGEEFTPTSLEAPELLTKVGELSEELLTGEIPASVLAALERDTAEQSIQAGLSGQISRNLVARDLGLTSLDLQTRGATLAAGVAEAQLRIDQFNEEQGLRAAAYNQELVEWEDKYATMVAETDVAQKELQLAALRLEAQNRQFRIMTESEIMRSHSARAIGGAQTFLDNLSEDFTDITGELDKILENFRS